MMGHPAWFDSHENKTMLAICARKQISRIGIVAIVWGMFAIIVGVNAVQDSPINAGILIPGVITCGVGVYAATRPSLRAILAETAVMVLLLFWNIGMATLNFVLVGQVNIAWVIFPLIIVGALVNEYRRLKHIGPLIESLDPEEIRTTERICKSLLAKSLKTEPNVVQTIDKKCRAQLMEGQALFMQRDMTRAFVGSKEDIRAAAADPNGKKITFTFFHPLGTLKYRFDKKHSEKLKAWFCSESEPNPETADAL